MVGGAGGGVVVGVQCKKRQGVCVGNASVGGKRGRFAASRK